jgi:hypothetical protein
VKLKNQISFFLIAVFAITACKKSPNPDTKTSADIYVVGSMMAANGYNLATYWKNGVAVTLTANLAPSSANAIAINGNDVYIAGVATINNKVTAVYWKNGEMIKLTNGSSGWASANGIAVNGNDVYVAGNAVNGDDVTVVGYNGLGATYWKNGLATKLPDSTGFGGYHSSANGIAINGNDIYKSGNISGRVTSGPAYWKNGVAISLSDGTFAEQATCIAVNGSDVYVGGTTVSNKNIAYWKNDLPTVITDGPYINPVSAILVKSNDVYLTGTSSLTGAPSTSYNIVATYWKNGVSTKFTDGTVPGYQGFVSWATGIAISGSDIYVSGELGSDAVYWKNGVISHLSKNSRANGIVVVPH